jgi:transposase
METYAYLEATILNLFTAINLKLSNEMQQFYEMHKDQLHVEYFPSYSPELNPAEQPWREVKKWLAMRYWIGKEGLKEQLLSAFQEDFVVAPIYDYLLP